MSTDATTCDHTPSPERVARRRPARSRSAASRAIDLARFAPRIRGSRGRQAPAGHDNGSVPPDHPSPVPPPAATRPAPASFHVMAKPTGAICNLDCDYCFFLTKEQLYPGSSFRMAEPVLEPPAVWPLAHGLCDAPKRWLSPYTA